MVVLFPDVADGVTGKANFLKRLIIELTKLDVKCIFNPTRQHDLNFHLIKIKRKTEAKNIVRLNGVYHNTTQPYKKMNKEISDNIQEAHGIIYQSKFSRKMCNKYLKIPSIKHQNVIYNGADPKFYISHLDVGEEYSVYFMTSSRWRPHKRLKDIVESFILANIKNSCLLVAGDVSKSGESNAFFGKYNNVKYLGSISQYALVNYYKLCSASIHLCWFDSCPNSVVESLSAGVPVITNNVGGTHEIVKHAGGYICEIDKPYDLNPVDLYNPPSIDRKKVAVALRKSIEDKIVVNKDIFDIKNIALQYKKFFERVLKN